MKNSKQLREEIAALTDRVRAISDKARVENRELSAEEKTTIEAAIGLGDNKGQVAALEAELETALKVEALLAKSPVTPTATIEPSADFKPTVKDVFYRPGSLKAFKNEQDAYKAGRFAAATLFNHGPSKQWCHDNGIDARYQAAHNESTNELGGFLVIPEWERAIIDLREQYGVFRANAKVTPMASDTKRIPRRSTGLTAYFANEAGSMTESTKSWDQIELVAKKIYVLTKYSNELNDDAYISIGDDLVQESAYQISYKEDLCGFLGDGTSTYGGMVGVKNAVAAGSQITAASGHTTFATLTLGDFETMLGALPMYVRNPKWYVSRIGYYASMRRLMDAAGGNSIADVAAGAPEKFLGVPVVFSQVLPTALTSTTGTHALYLGDLAMAATLGDRRGITVKRTDDRYFDTDELGIRVTSRFDINVHERGTATAAGPILQLLFA